jgi:hypothetical protein
VTTLDAGGKRCRNTKLPHLPQKANWMPALLMKVSCLEEGGRQWGGMHIVACTLNHVMNESYHERMSLNQDMNVALIVMCFMHMSTKL